MAAIRGAPFRSPPAARVRRWRRIPAAAAAGMSGSGAIHRMLVLGTGFVGRYAPERSIEHEDEEGESGWRVSGTCTTAAKKIELEKIGMDAFIFDATKSKPAENVSVDNHRSNGISAASVGTAAGGTTEIVVHGSTGLLHPAGKDSILPLGQNMVKLATRVDQRLTMGKKGYERVKERFMERFICTR